MGLISLPNHDEVSPPRVAVFSLRNLEKHVSRSYGFEFEDLICKQLDSAKLIAPAASDSFRFSRRIKNRITRRTGMNRVTAISDFGRSRFRLSTDFDLFFFSAAQSRDLVELSLVPDWRDRSNLAICWLQEVWGNDIHDQNHTLDLLNEFDHVVCSFHQSLEPLRERLSVPVTYLPWGVDAELFCPIPDAPRRVIDVASIGVVPKETEKQLVRYADRTGRFFLYQTVFGPSEMQSHYEHRQNYAGILKRSKYFLCYAAKFANVAARGRQVEFGPRYAEGIAAGAVLLGDQIDNSAYRDWFDWSDAVIPLSANETRVGEIVEQLESEPDRIASARRANLLAALTRLDNLYRWKDVLEIAGMSETSGMQLRHRRLLDLAQLVETASEDVLLGTATT